MKPNAVGPKFHLHLIFKFWSTVSFVVTDVIPENLVFRLERLHSLKSDKAIFL